ncbi:MAG: DUF58 domain-containing protein [Bacteroidales bacterium]|nr:DUF58 domain-containing protein [Bacteroidales bacterium]
METSELLQRVRRIEIKTKGLSQNIFAGEYHSLFKGRGMAFSEVREFQYGDSVRDIDWNVTARFGKPFIKVFEEERELTLMLLIDVSASQALGSRLRTKRELVAEIAAVLSFSAMQNNDKIGVILFSDRIEKFIPPQKGSKKHVLRIIRELLEFTPQSKGTNIANALHYFTNAMKRRCTAFVISDFNTNTSLYDTLSIARKKHDVKAIRVFDTLETNLPQVGMMRLYDVETGEQKWVNSSSTSVQEQVKHNYTRRVEQVKNDFKRARIDSVHIQTDEDYVKSLIQLFSLR